MNGEISLKSTPGKGSIFSVVYRNVEIVATKLSIIDDCLEKAHEISFNKARVMIVDDIDSNRELLKEYLIKADTIVSVTEDRAEAVSLCREFTPDIILMDIMMPEMDGYHVCKKIREKSNAGSIPLIFITAKTETDDIVKGFNAGGIDYITKPFNSAELLARVGTHAALKRAKDEEKIDLLLAKHIQENMLPKNISGIKNFNFILKYLPTREVGGDIYDIAEISPGYVRIFLADATGHGVQGALVTMMIKGEYEKIKYDISDTDKLLLELNNRFIDSYRYVERFFTAFVIDIDSNNNMLHYSSAGHACQYLFNCSRIEELCNTGKMIGIVKDCSFKKISFSHTADDKLLLFTDGLYEQFNHSNEEFSEKRIKLFLNGSLPVGNIIESILTDLKQFSGDRPFNENDDITIIGVECV